MLPFCLLAMWAALILGARKVGLDEVHPDGRDTRT